MPGRHRAHPGTADTGDRFGTVAPALVPPQSGARSDSPAPEDNGSPAARDPAPMLLQSIFRPSMAAAEYAAPIRACGVLAPKEDPVRRTAQSMRRLGPIPHVRADTNRRSVVRTSRRARVR